METMTTFVRGEQVDLPATIGGIRAALPAERRAAFDAAIDGATLATVQMVMADWITSLLDDSEARETFERLEREEAERTAA